MAPANGFSPSNLFQDTNRPQLIKVSDNLVFPCSSSAESLRFDVFSALSSSAPATNYNFTGTLTTRLNVLNDPKLIDNHLRSAAPAATAPAKSTPTQTNRLAGAAARATGSPRKSSLHSTSNPYSVLSLDLKKEATAKFLSLIALGPITKSAAEHKFNLKQHVLSSDLADLFATHTRPYLSNDTFIEDDVFPTLALGVSQIKPSESYVILKDKAYKELRPWNITSYTDYERDLIIDNANNALNRLGYLETHPLRRLIVDKSASGSTHKKSLSLGGGILVSSRKASTANNSPQVTPSATSAPSPAPISSSFKKSYTESPRVAPSAKNTSSKADGSPLKEGVKRKYVASLSLSGSSSEDEKHPKRIKKDGKRSDSSGSQNSMTSTGTSYTLPSSVNEDAHSQFAHEEEAKLSTLPKHVPSLPSRPQSSAYTAEKKQQYYSQLASKFKTKYLEYEQLHRTLTSDHRRGNASEKKKQLMKLFEMHNSLAEWKRKLWDYHNENNMTEGIMNLSRHRKTPSGSAHPKILGSAPSSSQILGHERFQKAHTTSPAMAGSEQFPTKPPARRRPSAENRAQLKHKVALNY